MMSDVSLGSADAQPRAGRSLLVVDDNHTFRQVLRRVLERLGYAVDVASDGAEALTCLEARRYDAVLLDVMMPVMDGLTTMREIVRRYGDARPPVITVSSGEQHVEEAMLAAGAAAYLGKPCTPAALSATLDQHVRPFAA